MNEERRRFQSRPDKELYRLPKSAIKNFVAKERRQDELGRLREVQEQNKVWRRTVRLCLFLNIVLLSLATWEVLTR